MRTTDRSLFLALSRKGKPCVWSGSPSSPRQIVMVRSYDEGFDEASRVDRRETACLPPRLVAIRRGAKWATARQAYQEKDIILGRRLSSIPFPVFSREFFFRYLQLMNVTSC